MRYCCWLLALTALAGCLTPDYKQCASGTLCPAALECGPVTGCATADAIAACVGMAELGACTIDGGPGECRGGVCTPASCGNGLVDTTLGEVCDDGNTISGDGCSASCMSNETCGNGVLDVIKGEQCDDGNLVELDGCSRDCVIEPLTSTQLGTAPAVAAPARAYASMIYDPDRHVTVLFGGAADVLLNDTWQYDGATWVQVPTIGAPQKRFAQGTAYDSKRHRMIIHGGDGGQFLNDTWAFDGVAWTKIASDGPAARYVAMTYDPVRDRVVLFGGSTLASDFLKQQTWEFDGTSWTAITTPTLPPARFATALVFDPVCGRVVMFGGVPQGGGAALADTWVYDGADWTQLAPPVSPPGCHSSPIAWDTDRQAIVRGPGLGDAATWMFDGTTWTYLTNTVTNRAGATMVDDQIRHLEVLFGGLANGSIGASLGDTWELDPTSTWAQPAPPAPSARTGPAMGYDPRRGRVVLFGGHDGTNTDVADTWEHDGATWHRLAPTTSPPPRWGAKLVYDPVRKTLVMFGGSTGNSTFPNGNAIAGGTRTLFDDTWEWDGTSWTQLAPAHQPSARMAVGLAWDSVGQRIVMNGGWVGDASSGNPLDDTWSFDGTDWTDISQPVRPPARFGHGLVGDPASGRIVMFSGWTDNGGGSPPDDTWQLVGSTWTQLDTPMAPYARGDISLDYDTVGQRVLLVDGTAILGQGYNALSDMWQLVGSTWTQLEPDALPPGRAISAAVYDQQRARVITFGGVRYGGYINDTWATGWHAVVAPEVCTSGVDLDGDGATGCADPDCAAICTGCGDGVCTELESCRWCPSDCGACSPVCGDTFCDPGETQASCPGDCP